MVGKVAQDDRVVILDSERTLDARLIETDDDFAADIDDWHAHLTSLIDHFAALFEVGSDIVLHIRHIVRLKE